MNSFYRFAFIGLAGFCIDFSLFKLLFFLLPTALGARALSWLFAVLFTYCGNSAFTFSRPSGKLNFPGVARLRVLSNTRVEASREDRRIMRQPFLQLLLYVSSQAFGGSINIAVFSLFYFVLFGGNNQFIAFAIGTLAGLVVNYFGAKLSIGSA